MGERPRSTFAWLALELALGAGLLVTLGMRSDLDDFAIVLPVIIVVALVGGLAALFRRRSLFVAGVVGAILGTLLYDPAFHVTFGHNADSGDTCIIYSRMLAEIRFQGALMGAAAGFAIWSGVALLKRSRMGSRHGRI